MVFTATTSQRHHGRDVRPCHKTRCPGIFNSLLTTFIFFLFVFQARKSLWFGPLVGSGGEHPFVVAPKWICLAGVVL